MKLYDDNGREVTNPAVLKVLEAIKELVPELEKKEPDYSDIVLYDDEGNRVTNIATLRAVAESDRMIKEWQRRHAGARYSGAPRQAQLRNDGQGIPRILTLPHKNFAVTFTHTHLPTKLLHTGGITNCPAGFISAYPKSEKAS